MRVLNHKVDGIAFAQAHAMGGVMTPEIVVIHDTASRLARGNAAEYLRTAPNVSVHFVIERDGTIEQQVPLNRVAWHAGRSSFHGRHGCNQFSIGIELVNPGRMTRVGEDRALAWWGEEFPIGRSVCEEDLACLSYVTAEANTPQHGQGVWMDYPPQQIETLLKLLRALFEGVPTLRDITTHWYISPGRKVDAGPLFPFEQIRARILGRDDPADDEADRGSEPAPTATMVRIATAGSGLNMRRWPSFNPNVIASIPDGTTVPVLRDGVFDGRRWLRTMFDGREGWIVEAPYTQSA